MRERGLTQGDAARDLDYTPQYVGQVARGDANPSWEFICRFTARYEEERAQWAALAGFQEDGQKAGQSEPDPRFAEIARQAAEAAVERLLDGPSLLYRVGHGDPSDPPGAGREVLRRGLIERKKLWGRAFIPLYLQGGKESLTEQEALDILADLDAQREEGLI